MIVTGRLSPIMTGSQLKQARKQKGLTQEQAAKRLNLSQTYLSLVEKGKRRLTEKMTANAVRVLRLPASELPVKKNLTLLKPLDDEQLAAALAALGYPGFSHIKGARLKNPAEVLVSALGADSSDARIAEALPWLVLRISERNWNEVVSAAKLNDLQNLLGFVTSLARRVAEKSGELKKAAALKRREDELARSRLLRESTFHPESLTETEKRWIRQNRTPEAEFWNVLSDLNAEHLSYAA
jgi:transcriptional regulator with XRE-family HTH domain